MFVGYFWMIACFLVSVLAFSVYLPDINEFCQAHPNSSAFVLIAGMVGFAAIAGYPAMRCGSKAYRKSSSGQIYELKELLVRRGPTPAVARKLRQCERRIK